VPYQIKSVAIRDACIAVKTAKQRYKQTGKYNEVKFRSKKDTRQNCFIPKRAISKRGVYRTLLGVLKQGEPLPTPEGDGRLVKSNGRYFLCVPVLCEHIQSENQARIVALDPGIRTFITFFCPESCGKIGYGDFSRIQRLCHYLDRLISKRAKLILHKQRYKLSKAIDRRRWKIRNLIDELHHKTALFLVMNFDMILLPSFETKEMSSRAKRKIHNKSVRAMLTFAHYRFELFLKYKAKQYGKKVLIVNEAYTSKTASWTGELVNIGSSKSIKSNNIVVDRDYNGARGIFLRALRNTSSSIDE
jgi:putative transposase